MSGTTWEKTPQAKTELKAQSGGRLKFMIAGMLILSAVGYLIVTGTLSGQRYFITIDELLTQAEYADDTVRITGAVVGDSIVYDSENLILDFTVVNLPLEMEDLGQALHLAVNNPTASRLPVHMENEVMPDLLQHEAQAILTGSLGDDGVFYADELLLKCPSRYEEDVPEQIVEAGEVSLNTGN